MNSFSSKKSFTLIELVITIGLLALTLTATGGVLLSVVKSFQKQSAIQKIERNGDLALRVLEEKARKAKELEVTTAFARTDENEEGEGNPLSYSRYEMLKVSTTDAAGNPLDSYIGIGRNPTNGLNYFFVKDGTAPSGFPEISDSDIEKYKITNDTCSNGVNVFLAEVPLSEPYDPAAIPSELLALPSSIRINTTSIPSWVSATIEIELASCSDVYRNTELSKKFKTFITARGSY